MLKPVHFRLKSNVIVLSIAIALVWSSCEKDAIDIVDCTGITPTYTADIKAILDASCAKSGCHDPITKQKGFDFSTYNTAMPISQGDRFLGAIQRKDGFRPMPDDGPKLSADKIELLTCWVQNGSPQ